MASPTPIDIITKGEWKHAFFTTYALSLSFFESQLLKEGLYRNGCRDIHILTDVKGYQMSLSERQSARVGNEYRLSPARLRNGIFHPKTVYLAGKEDDLLLVGSGNLTFGGYGRNVECLEVFRKSESPTVFAEYADFLESLTLRDNLWIPADTGFETTITHIRENLRTNTEEIEKTARLLHSTFSPIAQQVAEAINALAPVEEIRVLSPFFEPQPKGIIEFATLVGAPKLTVGLIPENESKTSFNFGGKFEGIEVKAAHVSCESPRRLHAKWFELVLESGERVLLTGSVNATHKSLVSADNIEVAVLRKVDGSIEAELNWEPTTPPLSHEPCEFNASELDHRNLTVLARLGSDGTLRGEVAGLDPDENRCEINLSRRDGHAVEVNDVPIEAGKFSALIPNADDFQLATGLQVSVKTASASGSAWVEVDSLLHATRNNFLRPNVISSIFSSEATDDDYAELVRYLGISGHQHLGAFAPKVKASKAGKQSEEQDTLPEIVLGRDAFSTYTPTVGNSIDGGIAANQSGVSADSLNALIFRIRKHLSDSPKSAGSSGSRAESESDAGDSEEVKESQEEQSKQTDANNRALHDYQKHMQDLLKRAKSAEQKSAVFCLWIEGGFFVVDHRSDGPGEMGEIFAKAWLDTALSTFEGDASEALKSHAYDMLATIAALEVQRDSNLRNLARLHEKLNRFACKDAEIDDFEGYDSFSRNRFSILLNDRDEAVLHQAVERLLGTKTIAQQLALVDASYGKPLPAGLTLPQGAGSAIRAYKEQIDHSCAPPIKPLRPNSEACPHCHLKLSASTLATLRKDWFVQCSSSNEHFIIH